jgi:hypothetical protein
LSLSIFTNEPNLEKPNKKQKLSPKLKADGAKFALPTSILTSLTNNAVKRREKTCSKDNLEGTSLFPDEAQKDAVDNQFAPLAKGERIIEASKDDDLAFRSLSPCGLKRTCSFLATPVQLRSESCMPYLLATELLRARR